MPTAPLLKTLSMADSCLLSLPSIFTTKPSYSYLPNSSSKPLKLHFSCSRTSSSFSPLKQTIGIRNYPIVTFVASTSDWAQQEEDNNSTLTIEQQDEQPNWESQEVDESESPVVEASESEREVEEPETFVEPPEDAKIFVGNLPYTVDSEKLAMLFEQAGIVEISEVIYNRETDQSRGFGFVTMSTVEEAEKAVQMFHQFDLDGRLLTVNKAAPRGSRPERTPRVFQPAFRIYVGNLPWDVDNSRLEQVFSEHGKVVDARVVDDRETGRSRGFGFVTMSNETEMNDAIAALDGQSLGGRAIRVNAAEERPRRSF